MRIANDGEKFNWLVFDYYRYFDAAWVTDTVINHNYTAAQAKIDNLIVSRSKTNVKVLISRML